MRSILARALALLLLFGVAGAFDPYGPFESDTGKWIMSDENLGGPWYHTGHGITLGDDQNATITYSGTYDNVTVAGADMTVLKNLTSIGPGTFGGINITELSDNLLANDTRIDVLETNLDGNSTRISALENQTSHLNVIAGGSAGNHTLNGVAVGDVLNGVIYVSAGAENLTGVVDLGSEFTILDDDVIENAAHTDTTGGYLIVSWDSLQG